MPLLKMFVPTCRPDLFRKLLLSLVACPQLDDWQLYVCFQVYPMDELGQILSMPEARRIAHYDILDRRTAVYPLRVNASQRHAEPGAIWCQLDDDMEFLPQTNYATPVGYLRSTPTAGFVSCNWVRSEAFLKSKTTVEEWVTQPVVNMAGGMLARQDVMDAVAHSTLVPVAPYMFDDVQLGLTAYMHGYVNRRYRGSLLIHRIMASDGLRVLFRVKDAHVLNDARYITLEPSKETNEADTNYHMPSSANVTKLAHAFHQKNKTFIR